MHEADRERRVRTICVALPGVTERLSHGAPAFFVGRQFVMLWADGHHDHAFPHLWCAAPAGAQDEMVTAEPERFFRPPYVGGRGWVGVRLDGDVDWNEMAGICQDAFRTIAPRRLVAMLDHAEPDRPDAPPPSRQAGPEERGSRRSGSES